MMIKTVVDDLCERLSKEKGLKAEADALSEKLGLSREDVEKIGRILKEEGIISIDYPVSMLSKQVFILKKELAAERIVLPKGKEIANYSIEAHSVPASISVLSVKGEPRPVYSIDFPKIGPYTKAMLESIRDELARSVEVETEEIIDLRKSVALQNKFYEAARASLEKNIPRISEKETKELAGILLHSMHGLGDIELLAADDWLEEIAINGSAQPICVYHRKLGWLKTNLFVETEEQIYDYAASTGRKAGREISLLNPIMDAHLASGDRANATLFPISSFGDTMTIRRFAREPWTIIDFIDPELNTLSVEMASFLWLCIQYELNMLVAGGTASGKTSMLNTLCAFIPPSSRNITIEDTRELNLPSYLKFNWVSLTTRNPNPEGKGGVEMLDLMVSSLRMRPDRIIVGEVRKRREAEVLFEAMHTGHAVYSTIHADTSAQVLRRLIHPPFELPATELESLHFILSMYRDRRKGWRRAYELAEVTSASEEQLDLNTLYRWHAREDAFEKVNASSRIVEELNMYTGMNENEINSDMKQKQAILKWMLKRKIRSVEQVGSVMSIYYTEPEKVSEAAKKNAPPEKLIS